MPGTLHILTGKIASGKSTLAKQLAAQPETILLSEDQLLSTLYEGDMNEVTDYVRNSARLRTGLLPHVSELLNTGLSVVLDFAANTPDQRDWMRQIIEQSGCPHILHYLDVSDDICRARMHDRNARGNHPFQPTDEQFDWITSHFVPPHETEGFEVQPY